MEMQDLSKQYRKYYKSLEPTLNKPKTKAYSTIIFFFLVVSLFSWYAIRPTVQTILYLQREIADKSEVSKKMDDKINALIQAQAVYDGAQDKLKYLDEALPTDAGAMDVLAQLTKLAETTGATFSAIRMGGSPLPAATAEDASGTTPKPAADKNSEMTITLAVGGEYPAVSAFLKGIVDMRRLMTIDSIQIAKDDSAARIPQAQQVSPLSLTVKLRTYYSYSAQTVKDTP
jgi:Tfp pilus assembly protein PilO